MSTKPGPSKASRRASLPRASSSSVLASTDKRAPRVQSVLVKHGKYVAAGFAGCWWFNMRAAIESVYRGEGGWIRKTLILALGSHAFVIIIFLYLVLFLPYFRGYIPHYPEWQKSARLRVIVPVLTASILSSWTSYVVALSQAGKRSALEAVKDALSATAQADLSKASGHKGPGLFSAMAGATALYSLTFGLLGFIRAPKNTPVRKRE
ncbi:hypothetical protein BD324DRAFT_638594 [Kockovaella imperatae]|uniref:Uncharacterized protein n=1 Tax=Kockovaella imperatae TaxID=4999 RepID=A0A1Y1U720_9TREE|nr:hypothetical protein BD324DRAFT_638594 [Kockovaella imperatae]ORX33792.1 hypothetical protein BD324DRAFT_638594 [Kockovaella imperatae]